ncbi:MAG: sodium:solute symporter family protein [Candidatus Heteroscillospira sp.]|jgi:SSS family solute:Na+ symporter
MYLVLGTVAVYMVVMLAIGMAFKDKASDKDGYFLSGRQLPTPVVMLTFAATWIGASATLGKAGLAYENGVSAIAPTLGTFAAFFVFSAFSGRIRKIGAEYGIASIPDLFFKRYGKWPALIASVIIAWTMIGTTGTQMIASSSVLEMIFQPLGITYSTALVISTVVVIFYTCLSGMYGVAYTDVVQGLLLLAIIGVLLPVATLAKAGGLAAAIEVLPPSYFDLKLDGSMFGYAFTSFLYFVAGPPYWQRAFSASSSKSAQRGAIGGNIIIIFYSAMVVLVGILAAVIYTEIPDNVSHEMVLLLLTRDLMPPMVHALTVAAVVAVIMSTTDSYLILAAQTVACDVIGRIRPGISHDGLIRLSRWSVGLVGAGALVFALNFQNIFQAFMLSLTLFSAAIAVPCLAALFSRRATKQGMIAGMLSGLASALVWSGILHNPGGVSEAIVGSCVSLVALILVSACTYKLQEPAPFFE